MLIDTLIDTLDPIRPFMEFLNKKKLCSVPCKIVYLPDNDAVSDEDSEGFAAYIPDSLIMYVAGDLSCIEELTPEEQFETVLQSMAHEYIHHIQNSECREFGEEEAERRAEELVREFYGEGQAGERCSLCGKPYDTVWMAPDGIWQKVTGRTDGSGLRCIDCFDKEARDKGIFLYWQCGKEWGGEKDEP